MSSYDGTPTKKRKKSIFNGSSSSSSSSISAIVKPEVNVLGDDTVFGSGLTFGQLGKFTSKQLEEIVLKERQKRILTTEEEYKIKKVRRNVKNRESAQLSRKRKMHITSLMLDHIKYLEGQLTIAGLPFRSWKSICSSTDATSSSPTSPVMGTSSSSSLSAVGATAIPVQLHAPGATAGTPTIGGKIIASGKRNGAALLFAVVLFSVGFFFTFISNSPASKPITIPESVLSTPFVLLPDVASPLPAAHPASSAAVVPPKAAVVATARTIKQIDMPSSALVSKEDVSPSVTTSARSSPSATPSPHAGSTSRHRLLGNTPSDLSRIAIAGVQPKIVDPQPWCAKDNISYLFCNDVKRYDPPQIQDPSSSTIGILVPSASLDKTVVTPQGTRGSSNSNSGSVSNSVSDDLVEITCSVRDVTVIPRQGFRMVPKSSY